MSWDEIAQSVLDGIPINPQAALKVLCSGDDELLAVLQAAFRVRRHYHGRRVTLQILQNAKSGVCSEDCAFCSQALRYETGVARSPMQPVTAIIETGKQARQQNAVTYCIVTSARAPTDVDIETVCESARALKRIHPDLRLCASLGMLSSEQAKRLAEAGINRYNHNLETSRRFFPEIVSTHTYEDRLRTVRHAKSAGLEICCGGILGLGERLKDRVDLAIAIRKIDPQSVPVNFLDPRPGTPLENRSVLTPNDCLRALAMFRLVHPKCELRVAGGREKCLKHMQPMALFVADSIFTNGYLTTGGQGRSTDLDMIRDAGFVPSFNEQAVATKNTKRT